MASKAPFTPGTLTLINLKSIFTPGTLAGFLIEIDIEKL